MPHERCPSRSGINRFFGGVVEAQGSTAFLTHLKNLVAVTLLLVAILGTIAVVLIATANGAYSCHDYDIL
jgi:hypothetical protein